jgi:hypothetical protein
VNGTDQLEQAESEWQKVAAELARQYADHDGDPGELQALLVGLKPVFVRMASDQLDMTISAASVEDGVARLNAWVHPLLSG